jgi:hypothetical protein
MLGFQVPKLGSNENNRKNENPERGKIFLFKSTRCGVGNTAGQGGEYGGNGAHINR